MIGDQDEGANRQRPVKRVVASIIIFLSSYVAFSALLADAGLLGWVIGIFATLAGLLGIGLFLFPDRIRLGD